MIVSFVLAALPASAQELPIPALSPRAEIMQVVGTVEVRVDYASPAKRDREIFGGLVPFGELWRTGANRATTLSVSGPVTIAGTEVAEGRYAIFTKPGEEAWTVIINANPNQSGTASHDEALDVVRFEAEPVEGPAMERLTFAFHDVTDTGASLDLMWDGVKVAIPIEVDAEASLDAALDGMVPRTARRLAQAARYYSRTGAHDKAESTADLAIELDDGWYPLWTKAEVLRGADDLRGARRWARRAKRAADRSRRDDAGPSDFYYERIEAAIDDWR